MDISPSFEQLLQELEAQAASRKNTTTNHINTRLSLATIEKMDMICDQYKVTRSDLIRNALANYLKQLDYNE